MFTTGIKDEALYISTDEFDPKYGLHNSHVSRLWDYDCYTQEQSYGFDILGEPVPVLTFEEWLAWGYPYAV